MYNRYNYSPYHYGPYRYSPYERGPYHSSYYDSRDSLRNLWRSASGIDSTVFIPLPFMPGSLEQNARILKLNAISSGLDPEFQANEKLWRLRMEEEDRIIQARLAQERHTNEILAVASRAAENEKLSGRYWLRSALNKLKNWIALGSNLEKTQEVAEDDQHIAEQFIQELASIESNPYWEWARKRGGPADRDLHQAVKLSLIEAKGVASRVLWHLNRNAKPVQLLCPPAQLEVAIAKRQPPQIECQGIITETTTPFRPASPKDTKTFTSSLSGRSEAQQGTTATRFERKPDILRPTRYRPFWSYPEANQHTPHTTSTQSQLWTESERSDELPQRNIRLYTEEEFDEAVDEAYYDGSAKKEKELEERITFLESIVSTLEIRLEVSEELSIGQYPIAGVSSLNAGDHVETLSIFNMIQRLAKEGGSYARHELEELDNAEEHLVEGLWGGSNLMLMQALAHVLQAAISLLPAQRGEYYKLIGDLYEATAVTCVALGEPYLEAVGMLLFAACKMKKAA